MNMWMSKQYKAIDKWVLGGASYRVILPNELMNSHSNNMNILAEVHPSWHLAQKTQSSTDKESNSMNVLTVPPLVLCSTIR